MQIIIPFFFINNKMAVAELIYKIQLHFKCYEFSIVVLKIFFLKKEIFLKKNLKNYFSVYVFYKKILNPNVLRKKNILK